MRIGAVAASSRSPGAPKTASPPIRNCTSTSSATVATAAAARSSIRKAPAANPVRAARRCSTVSIGAPSRYTGR
jgi:hypothetical protein